MTIDYEPDEYWEDHCTHCGKPIEDPHEFDGECEECWKMNSQYRDTLTYPMACYFEEKVPRYGGSDPENILDTVFSEMMSSYHNDFEYGNDKRWRNFMEDFFKYLPENQHCEYIKYFAEDEGIDEWRKCFNI